MKQSASQDNGGQSDRIASGYPFSAIVGQQAMRTALLLNIVDPRVGGVLLMGEPGTGKSTAVRALRNLLPHIAVVAQCSFNCEPDDAEELCHDCRLRRSSAGELPVSIREMPLVTLPVGATEDRLIGTLNLEKAVHEGRVGLSPGLLAAAHRGILYIDEVNLLPDSLADALLDAVSSGVNFVERDGVSASHASSFSLVGTMNPGEGELRPQILDRFGLSVTSDILREGDSRVDVLMRRINYEHSIADRRRYLAQDQALATRLDAARTLLAEVECTREVVESVTEVVISAGVASHRADLVLLRTAMAHAAFRGRREVTPYDIAVSARLALGHRTSDPLVLDEAISKFLNTTVETSLEELLRLEDQDDGSGPEPAADVVPPWTAQPSPAGATESSVPHTPNGRARRAGAVPPHGGHARPDQEGDADTDDPPDTEARIRTTRIPGVSAAHLIARRGPRQRILVRPRILASSGGRAVSTRRSGDGPISLAATVVAAAQRSMASSGGPARSGNSGLLSLRASDIVRRPVTGRSAVALIVVLDASWSMAMDGVFRQAKAFLLAMLGSLRRGDRLAVVLAGGPKAELVVPPTRYPQQAVDALASLRARGRTPLVDGLAQAVSLCRQSWRFPGTSARAVIILTDGQENTAVAEQESVAQAAAGLRTAQVGGAVLAPIGSLHGRAGAARSIARRLGLEFLPLPPALRTTS
ncbi:VWA domain-containing protein [Streptomyces lonegramiae]|uniref:VWA domain-containing protein n=1 Tax=Streptomyces lonegramiae TaxID=3075524 RepID=A0ABU2XES0_9ACTN|nr:VWA domain-containing protein [Streptomyces sp. DSM 41529]MDT0543959.1 VWA domain-containing protein [Streptomyces sp. DSM 41529]